MKDDVGDEVVESVCVESNMCLTSRTDKPVRMRTSEFEKYGRAMMLMQRIAGGISKNGKCAR